MVIICANSCEKLTKRNRVICDHYMSQFMSKVDQKRNWVKLKSVQTLLRIACLANRKSYVIIIYANACEKLTKSENVSS